MFRETEKWATSLGVGYSAFASIFRDRRKLREPRRLPLRVAISATLRHARAAAHRVPRRVGPLDRARAAHVVPSGSVSPASRAISEARTSSSLDDGTGRTHPLSPFQNSTLHPSLAD